MSRDIQVPFRHNRNGLDPKLQKRAIDAYNFALREYAEENGDNFIEYDGQLGQDQLHLNDAGVESLAKYIYYTCADVDKKDPIYASMLVFVLEIISNIYLYRYIYNIFL